LGRGLVRHTRLGEQGAGERETAAVDALVVGLEAGGADLERGSIEPDGLGGPAALLDDAGEVVGGVGDLEAVGGLEAGDHVEGCPEALLGALEVVLVEQEHAQVVEAGGDDRVLGAVESLAHGERLGEEPLGLVEVAQLLVGRGEVGEAVGGDFGVARVEGAAHREGFLVEGQGEAVGAGPVVGAGEAVHRFGVGGVGGVLAADGARTRSSWARALSTERRER
jgi:hypothetical protein